MPLTPISQRPTPKIKMFIKPFRLQYDVVRPLLPSESLRRLLHHSSRSSTAASRIFAVYLVKSIGFSKIEAISLSNEVRLWSRISVFNWETIRRRTNLRLQDLRGRKVKSRVFKVTRKKIQNEMIMESVLRFNRH